MPFSLKPRLKFFKGQHRIAIFGVKFCFFLFGNAGANKDNGCIGLRFDQACRGPAWEKGRVRAWAGQEGGTFELKS